MKLNIIIAPLCAAVLALSGCSGGAASGGAEGGEAGSSFTQPADTGVTDDTIKLGITLPESGPLSSFGAVRVGLQAYIDKVNGEGGVTSGDGKTRTIELVSMDDAYDPSRARSNVEKLVNEDEVFALVSCFGTATQLAARPVVEEAGVPDLWVGSGNPAISDPEHPLLTGIAVPTAVEGRIFAKYLADNVPDSKVAILAQNGDFGDPFVDGFTAGIEGTGVTIADQQTFEPTDTGVRQQVTSLAASGADAFFVVAPGAFALQAINNAHTVGWDPLTLVPSGTALDLKQLGTLDPGAGDGLLLAASYKDPADTDDEAVAEYVAAYEAVSGSSSYPINQGMSGWLSGILTVRAIESLETVDRPSLVEAIHNLSIDEATVVQDGVTLQTSDGDNYIVEGQLLSRYDAAAKTLEPVEVVDTNGENVD